MSAGAQLDQFSPSEPPPLDVLVRRADEQLRALAERCEREGKLLLATVGHLQSLAEAQRRGLDGEHMYRVFRVAVTGQHIVLRDVETLCGATSVFATPSPVEAFRWIVARPTHVPWREGASAAE